jgi:MFS family permease
MKVGPIVDAGSARAGDGGDETEREWLNRNFAELLQEVRVAETGVQILFAFLLTLPFTQRFGDLAGRDVAAYSVSAVGAAVATVMLVAPVSFHRLTFRQGRKPELVAFASVLALIGLISFGVALIAAAFLIADVVLGLGTAIGFAALIVGLEALLWFVLPMTKRDDPHKRRLGTGPDA